MAKRGSNGAEPQPHKKRATSTEGPEAFTSLATFVSNFFFSVFISDNETIFDITFDDGYARDVVQQGDGQKFNFATFKKFLEEERRVFSDRQLVSQSFVVSPGDAAGLTGTVGHVIKVSAVQQDKRVEIDIISVLNIVFDEKLGERKIKTESFVLATS